MWKILVMVMIGISMLSPMVNAQIPWFNDPIREDKLIIEDPSLWDAIDDYFIYNPINLTCDCNVTGIGGGNSTEEMVDAVMSQSNNTITYDDAGNEWGVNQAWVSGLIPPIPDVSDIWVNESGDNMTGTLGFVASEPIIMTLPQGSLKFGSIAGFPGLIGSTVFFGDLSNYVLTRPTDPMIINANNGITTNDWFRMDNNLNITKNLTLHDGASGSSLVTYYDSTINSWVQEVV